MGTDNGGLTPLGYTAPDDDMEPGIELDEVFGAFDADLGAVLPVEPKDGQ
jgi:hypothetical protein